MIEEEEKEEEEKEEEVEEEEEAVYTCAQKPVPCAGALLCLSINPVPSSAKLWTTSDLKLPKRKSKLQFSICYLICD